MLTGLFGNVRAAPGWRRWLPAASWAAVALIFLALARGLPGETFFVGDPGVKLIAATRSNPDRPLEVPLPRIGGEPVPYVEPFFVVHDAHSHAVTSEIFPLASSPFIQMFGVRGAYVLPALGFFIGIAGCVRLAEVLGVQARPGAVMLTGMLGTPLLFYGLEFWEHAPAFAVAAVATMTLVSSLHGLDATAPGASDARGRALVSGLLYGVAIMLRPEAVCFVAAVAAASPLLTSRVPWRALLGCLAGVMLALLPLTLYSIVHFGEAVPPHVGTHAALLTADWLAVRGAVLSRWFLPSAGGGGPWWGIALLVMIAAGWSRFQGPSGSRHFLGLTAMLTIALAVVTAPNDGGGQWGPRYLLLAFVPATLLTASVLAAVFRVRPLGALVVIAAATAGLWIQRDGYRELRQTKMIYGRVLDFVRGEVPFNGYAATDLWWLDQVAAAAALDRHILFLASGDAWRDGLSRLASARVDSLTIFRSDEGPDGDDDWLPTSCYREVGRRRIPERSLTAIRARRTCP
jgi:hypothetical protein